MSDDRPPPGFSLQRWSRRKLAAARAAPAPAPPAASDTRPAATVPAAAAPAAPTGGEPPAPELPPIDALTFDSDFAAYLQPKVEETLRRQALKKLFGDPRFNVMDGLDVYIDDYSQPDPIPPELVKEMVHARYIFDPPATRIRPDGIVEDVPPSEVTTGEATTDAAAPALPAAAAASASGGAGVATGPAVPEPAASRATEGPPLAVEAAAVPGLAAGPAQPQGHRPDEAIAAGKSTGAAPEGP
jgi:hypothetical protein